MPATQAHPAGQAQQFGDVARPPAAPVQELRRPARVQAVGDGEAESAVAADQGAEVILAADRLLLLFRSLPHRALAVQQVYRIP